MKKYFFIAASEKFLTIEEPLEEILKERRRNYKENNREIDFWLLKRPLFLKSSQFQNLYNKIPKPQAAVVSNDKKFIIFLKLRMEFVASGEFDAPSLDIVDPLAEEK
tara:strand:- start:810 stop:1130 length:321 start_codon:yes stop_codon:yes gene_type:complete